MASSGIQDLGNMSPKEKKEFRNKYNTFFFDMDGTLAKLDKSPIDGAVDGVAALAKNGKELYMFTDTCLHTRAFLVQHIQRTFPHFKEGNVISAAWLIVQHLKNIGFSKKVYAIGEPSGIVKELTDAGFEVEVDQETRHLEMADLFQIPLDPAVGAVVVGGDVNYTYLKMFKAVNYLRDPAMLFFVSHTPIVALLNPVVPAAGALALPIEKISGRKPSSCSKSSPASVEFVRGLGHDMKHCLFVGDGLQNDIACGNLCGMDTLLVLSGSSNLASVERARQRGDIHHIPTYIADSVAVFSDIFED